MNRNRLLQWLAGWIVLCALAWAQTGDPDLAEGLRLLEEGRTTLAEKALNNARDYFLKLTQTNAGNAIYFYELARVDQYPAVRARCARTARLQWPRWSQLSRRRSRRSG